MNISRQEGFQAMLRRELRAYLDEQKTVFPQDEILRIDLHCHDANSDVPDELIGRILNVPETWITSECLLGYLEAAECNAFTITNHNNARSCYAMQDKGLDILAGAEFSCFAPDFEIGIHVLAYGFTPDEEAMLEKLRGNLYQFVEYARSRDIPLIWAHPLYHYSGKKLPPQAFFDKMILLFERFETLNGQRDTLQNMLVREWIERATPEYIDDCARKFGIAPDTFCADPYRKALAGGSDSHIGLFAGQTGSYLHVPDLKERLKTTAASALALEAIKQGRIAPYGAHQNSEKLTITFLNYVCQIALNYKDPGLMRMLLHKGDISDKIAALAASNIFCEVRHHSVTLSFVKLFYDCMMGRKPSSLKRMFVRPAYKPIFDLAADIARYHGKNNGADSYYASILAINTHLHKILSERIENKMKEFDKEGAIKSKSLDEIMSGLELPSFVRAYIGDGKEGKKKSPINLPAILDGLPFPFFTQLFILAAHYTGAKVLFNTRPFLRQFAAHTGKYLQPARALWLTDTFADSNGVSMFLRELHREIKKRNLPIDILVCDKNLQPDDHLIVLPPVTSFALPSFPDYSVNIPNFVELHNLFLKGEYDRVVCSTEGVMALCALYLKHAYTVEASFYLHTDWLMFARKTLNITGDNLDRLRRLLRFLYRSFDRVLALNSDQRKWLSGASMNLDPTRVCAAAHWAAECFKPQTADKRRLFGVTDDTPVLLYVGRVSREKGVMELPYIVRRIRQICPDARLVIVGKGPAVEPLRDEAPDTQFINWLPQSELPHVYSSADLLLLPSKFDTFCNVALEALSCGLPVAAYDNKGPKDIILNGECGFLVKSQDEMADRAAEYLQNSLATAFRQAAISRSKSYNADAIIAELLATIGIEDNQ